MRYAVYGAAGLITVLIVVLIAVSGGKKANTSLNTGDVPALSSAFAQRAEQEGEAGDAYLTEGDGLTADPESGEAGISDESAAIGQLTDESDEVVTSAETTVAFTGELSKGDDDPIIAEVQARLMELGYMDSDEPTEHFGSITKHALERFQAHNELPDDGICGEATYNLLMSEEAKIYVMQAGDSGDDVEGIQMRLYELGYIDNRANITGTFGEKTTDAAKLFQKKNDLTADGKVGVKTISMLYGEDVESNAYSYGDEAPIIKECQQKLYELGYITSKKNVTGEFNSVTRSAIKTFQRSNDLTADGALGPVTRDLLLSGKVQEKVLQLGDSGTDVKNAQKRLKELNYLTSSSVTGYYGELTAEAVKAFQKRMKLTRDGVLGAYTLKVLNSSNAKKASQPVSSSSSSSSGSSSSGSSSSGSSGSSGSGSAVSGTGVTRLISVAESKIGCKYVTGAKGPNSFDCSGFVYYCLKQAGVSASYMTSIMWRSTSRYTRISSMGSIQAGDILVFSGNTSSTGHVGIYIGGGKMIDASSSAGQVRKSTTVLKSGAYWTSHFLMAYRVF